MNIFRKFLPVLAAACTVISVFKAETVTAEAEENSSQYPMACKIYEVDNVNAAGGFDKVSCHTDYRSAITALGKLGDDGVVRHRSSLSPTKIVAMNNGMVFAYPFRSGSSMMHYYQDRNFSGSYATTYSGQHYQARYLNTAFYNGDGTGSVKLNLNGFEGYAELKDLDLVPVRFFTSKLKITLGGNETFYNTPEEPYEMIPRMNSFTCKTNGLYKDLLFNSFYGWPDDTGMSMQTSYNLALPAAEWMQDGTVYYSDNGYDFYTDMGFHNYAGQYFNYYQFMPLRTKTKIPAEVFDAYLKAQSVRSDSRLYGAAQDFIDAQNEYGVNALMIYSMACLESAYGTSYYAMNRNNFFGWGAYDTDPNQAASYETVREGIMNQMSENLAGFLDMNDWRYYGSLIGNKGAGFNLKYASAVYWGLQIASIAYRIDKLSCGNNGELTDFNSIPVGIVTNPAATASLTKGGKTAYDITSCNGNYIPVYPVAVLAEEDGYYKTQCTNYVEDGKIQFIKSSEDVRPYNWEESVGWFKKEDVTLINDVKIEEPQPVIGEAVETLGSIAFDQGILTLKGNAYREGVSETDGNALKTRIVITDPEYHDVQSADAKRDGHAWQADLDLNELNDGTYFIRCEYSYVKTPEYSGVYYLKADEVPAERIINALKYSFLKDSQGYVNLKKETITCSEGSHYDEETGGCLADIVREWAPVPADDVSLLRGVNEIRFDETKKILTIDGLAFSQKTADASTISHELILVNTETNQEYAVPALTSDSAGMEKIGFVSDLDLNGIEAGNYYLRVRLHHDETQCEGALFTNLEGIEQTIVNEAGETVRFFANPLSNYRLEISVEKQSLNLDDVNKPSRMTSMFAYQSMAMDEGMLKIDGIGIIYHAPMAESDSCSYIMYLEDEEGNLIKENCTAKESGMDFSQILGTSSRLTHVSFDAAFDLNELKAGSYRLYLEITTADYHDIFEIYSITPDTLKSYETDHSICSLGTTDVRSRYMLKIEGKGE